MIDPGVRKAPECNKYLRITFQTKSAMNRAIGPGATTLSHPPPARPNLCLVPHHINPIQNPTTT